jgi:uncharacterized protein
MELPPCPVCGRPVDPQATQAMPFCSLRCRQIDLARWLDERYGLPYESLDEPPEGPPASGPPGSEDAG